MSSFGRKGLRPDMAPPARPKPFGRAQDSLSSSSVELDQDEMAALRNAFIASERARQAQPAQRAETGGSAGGAGLGISAPQAAAHIPRSRPERSMALAYVLWFFLGQLSAHRFYLGAGRSALIQLGLFFCSLLIFFLVPVLGAVGLIAWALWLLGDVFLISGLHRRYSQEVDPRAVFA